MANVISFFNKAPVQLTILREWHRLLAERLAAAGHRYRLLIFSGALDDQLKESASDLGQIVFLDPRQKPYATLVPLLDRYLREHSVDLMIAHHVNPLQLTRLVMRNRLRGTGTKFVYYKHGAGRLIENAWDPRKYVSPLAIIGAAADGVVGVSQAIVDNCLNRGVDPRKVRLIYNGILTSRFEGVDARERIRSELGIPGDHQIVTTIKDARPDVGMQDLVLSAEKVLRVLPKVTFLLVGGGELTPSLRSMTDRLGIGANFRFVGVRHDIPEIVSASTITLDPSPVEAFGIVIIESMAGRVPVIAVRKWGPAEIIEDGLSGLLVEPGPPADFSPAILALLTNPELRERMGESAFQRVKSRFTIERTTEAIVEMASDLLGESRTPGPG